MTVTRRVLLAVLGVTLAACGAGTAPGQSPMQPAAIAQVTPPPPTAAPAVTPDSSTEARPTRPTAKPTPTATPVPVPPKPTGVKLHEEIESLCEEDPPEGDTCGIGDSTFTLSWKAPRTKGIEIRVYGLLECLSRPENPPDSSNGPCLVKGTKLPSSAKRLIAKADASDGVISWTAGQPEGCDMAEQIAGPDGETFYAIVLAAYNTAGKPSVFAIADPGEWWTPEPGDMPC